MKISGFSFVRNGFDYGVPFTESILSILPICDEFVVAVGDSKDGTKEAIEQLGYDKIKIIDTTWNPDLRAGGKVFAQQCNIALDNITGDWAFHLQADEVIHEKSLPVIQQIIAAYENDERVEGFILPFLHFWGDYKHIRTSRRMHKHEIRIFRNKAFVRSYRDSQGFRIYNSLEQYQTAEEKGNKLNVRKINEPIYHYSGVRTPKMFSKKHSQFRFYYGDEMPVNEEELFHSLYAVDRVEKFDKSHPAVMAEKIQKFPYKFEFKKEQAVWKLKDRLVQPIEDILGIRFGEYRNYKLIK